MTSLVLTVIGDDQAGLVDALSGVIAEHGGNWQKSHMTQLAGKFAGIVLVTVADAKADDLVAALAPLEDRGLLDITVEVVAGADEAEGAESAQDEEDGATGSAARRSYSLHLVGQDRPGIVHDISQALAERGVSISDLVTATTSAPMAGGLLFEAEATLDLPAQVSLEELREALEALANELMVDIDFST
ncbi:MAG: ACT domain-containing protein [Actinomycetia bacterium]|nr:ACT domain-containing protein [Actinomycetes bacterium]